ncbi:hypothetical protein [Legionella sp. PC997]|uniref:hypothetical protein n=1 Tax=Legionella sp. PC997 TaxID=2755562 RepID=UPI0015FB856E|nr:hypothetical protein [Legionella sp. PC997]QMT59891.1 hypothetical protein HBNCFIEN_01260 [Legionella sp. PC997]
MHQTLSSIPFIWTFVMMSFLAQGAPFSLDNMIKVTPENDTQCVQYYLYKGVLYCNSTTDSNPIDSQIRNYEQLKISFDERPWKMAWGNKNSIGTTIEYVPAGDDINHWLELVTSQYFPGLQKKTSLKQFANTLIKNLTDLGYQPIITFHENTENRVLLEIRIEKPENQIRDELEMLIKDNNGIYLLQYVIKKSDMGNENRQRWINNLKNSVKLKEAGPQNTMQ